MSDKLQTVAAEIDRIADKACELFGSGVSGFAQELSVAKAMMDLDELLTPEVMKPIMALMNSSLGFKTDRDPARPVKQSDGTWKEPKPYHDFVVKRIFIEARLRGFHVIGNHFNIIAGNFYAAQNGLNFKVKKLTKGTFEWSNDAVDFQGSFARVKFRASWTFNGQKGAIGIRPDDPCIFSVNVYEKTTPDAVVGKGLRKLLNRVHERITGQVTPEGEIDDSVAGVPSEPKEPVKLIFGAAEERAAYPASGVGAASAGPVAPPSPTKDQEPPLQAEASTAGGALKATKTIVDNHTPTGFTRVEPELNPLVKALMDFLVDSEVSFNDFRLWLQVTGGARDADSWASWHEVPEALAIYLRDHPKDLRKCVTLYSTGKKAPDNRPKTAGEELLSTINIL